MCLTSLTGTGWQWMHVDAQIVAVRSAGHAESRSNPQPEEIIVIC